LARTAKVLGEDHPDTLLSARDLATNLRSLGQTHQAEMIEAQFHHVRDHGNEHRVET
jgi:hypothetical protein